MNFAHNAVEEGFVALAVTAEKANLSRITNVRDIVSQLQ
jgi:hypothetical protein